MNITIITWPQAMNSEHDLMRRSISRGDTSVITYIWSPLLNKLEEVKWNDINEQHQA